MPTCKGRPRQTTPLCTCCSQLTDGKSGEPCALTSDWLLSACLIKCSRSSILTSDSCLGKPNEQCAFREPLVLQGNSFFMSHKGLLWHPS